MKQLVFALVDCDSFYASCESHSLFRPDLKSSAVIVASNNDGAVVARNKKAKALGIKMGEPLFKIQDLLRRECVAVFSSNYATYANMSARVMRTLARFTPSLEVYSIDEAFLDLTGMTVELNALGHEIRNTISRNIGLSVGVGISTTKTLAKLANRAAKTYPGCGGVVDLTDPTRQRRLMSITPVEDVWGIGRRLSARLNALGIMTAKDLADADTRFIREQFSVVVERTVRELRGESCMPLELIPPVQKQIVHSRSFGAPITAFSDMREALHCYAAKATEKMRKQKLRVKTFSVFIQTSPFKDGYYYNSASTQLCDPTSDTRLILAHSTKLLKSIWRDGYFYIRAGIMLLELRPAETEQLPLMGVTDTRSEALMDLIDGINKKSGAKIQFGSQIGRAHV